LKSEMPGQYSVGRVLKPWGRSLLRVRHLPGVGTGRRGVGQL